MSRTPRTPRHLLRDSVTLTPATVSTEASSGSPEWTYTGATSVTVQGRLQPLSSSESIMYGRDVGTVVYQLFISPFDNNGQAISYAHDVWKTVRVTISGVTYRVDGPARDPDGAGCLLQLTLERM
jgi:hypothetical protein